MDQLRKKSFSFFIGTLLVFLFSSPLAHAAAPYASLSAGLGFLTNSSADDGVVKVEDVWGFNTGYLVNGAVGLDGDMYRVEAAIGYQSNSIDTLLGIEIPGDWNWRVSILSFMANGYLDIESEGSTVTPYLTAGAGIANVSFNDGITSDDDTVFAYQLGAGIGFEVSEDTTVDVGYRYFATSDVDPGGYGVDYSMASHNAVVGVRFAF
ncbi:MAG: porin family protein [Chlorobium phaeobacteroides]|nr:porin family protein [Chlorobium phaeobacteroides]MBL6957249.1 porin family protein [Chlorobium phaeobacteroides]